MFVHLFQFQKNMSQRKILSPMHLHHQNFPGISKTPNIYKFGSDLALLNCLHMAGWESRVSYLIYICKNCINLKNTGQLVYSLVSSLIQYRLNSSSMSHKTEIKKFKITTTEHTGSNNHGHSVYRYRLMRIWNEKEKPLMIIGCNPSKANVCTTDPTMDKVSNIAFNNGYGGVIVSNLFA